MRITELFGRFKTTNTTANPAVDTPTSYDPEVDTPSSYKVNFTVGNIPYKFVAYQDPEESPGDWEIDFLDPTSKTPFGVTGAGNAVQVFNIVLEILKDFISKKGNLIRRLGFAAKEPSRQKLYTRMSALSKTILPNWTFEQKGPLFYFTRPGLSWLGYSVEQGYNNKSPVKVKAPTEDKAKEAVLKNPNFKGADPTGIVVKAPPQR